MRESKGTPAKDPWYWCTSEGAREQVLRLGLETSFREKLEWLEEAENLTIRFREQREREWKNKRQRS
ncbi:MAG: hypothetical protein KF749_17370 [Bacteroidetes bacterium]|nr:hypothetical protein [Bacteroidota bacterium]MCW5896042.1 hypothetical protein [Bacteroidota bacterium]